MQQEHGLKDVEALGGNAPAPMGPQQGSNATWDGGGSAFRAAGLFSLQDQLGVFEGYSEDEDFNWSLVSSRPLPDPHGAQHPDSRSPQHEEHGSSPQEADQLPQVDGAGDDSISGDDGTRSGVQDPDKGLLQEADSRDGPRQRSSHSNAAQQSADPAGSQQTHSSSQRFGGLPLQKPSPSTASAPAGAAALEDTGTAQASERRSHFYDSELPQHRPC